MYGLLIIFLTYINHHGIMLDMETEILSPSTIKWTEADSDLIRALQAKSGIIGISDLVRNALRALAIKEDVTL